MSAPFTPTVWAKLIMLGLLVTALSGATLVPVGYLSFALDSPLAGQTAFNFVNATGVQGCTVDAPVCDQLFITGTLSLDYGQGEVVQAPLVSALGAGSWLPPEWIFNDPRVPVTVTFTGSTPLLSVSLFDGTIQQLAGTIAGGPVDLINSPEIILYASTVPIPEPGTLLFMSSAILVAWAALRRWLPHRPM
ncbi:MAG: hypothetical protein NTV70_17790 [Acidobacteria bacterium]|nr:hypothetical protein [Acidobacteriota bacterium]